VVRFSGTRLDWDRPKEIEHESRIISVANILIVEDNADIRELMTLLLQAEGLSVITAEDCASGFEILLRQKLDLVITDVMLPDYSGLQFIRWMRETIMNADTPAIAMTAFEPGYLVAAIHLGADAVIHKPEGIDQLTETVKAVLAEKGRQREDVQARASPGHRLAM
jgi:DNA-binding response OmpR family regulator